MNGLPIQLLRLTVYLVAAGVALLGAGQAIFLAVRLPGNRRLLLPAAGALALIVWLLLAAGALHAPVGLERLDVELRARSSLVVFFLWALTEFTRLELGPPPPRWWWAQRAVLTAMQVAAPCSRWGLFAGSVDVATLAAERAGRPTQGPALVADGLGLAAVFGTVACLAATAGWTLFRGRRSHPGLAAALVFNAVAAALDGLTIVAGWSLPLYFTALAYPPYVVYVSAHALRLALGTRRATHMRSLAEERLSAVLECISSAIVVADRAWRVERINGAASRLLGVTPSEAVGRLLSDVVRLDDPTHRRWLSIRQAIAAGRTLSPPDRVLLRQAGGALVACSVTGSPIAAAAQKEAPDAPGGAVLVLRDLRSEEAAQGDRQRALDLQVVSATTTALSKGFSELLSEVRRGATELERLDGSAAGFSELITSADAALALAGRLAPPAHALTTEPA